MKKIYTIVLLISILTLAIYVSASTVKKTSAQNPAAPYYSVDPAVVTPATAVGENFTVTLKLNNATIDNVPNGISGIELHLAWNTTLIQPVRFTNDIGITGGVLTPPSILYGLAAGFYDNNSNIISSAPYTNAATFAAGAASSTGPWNATTGNIAEITFTVISQAPPFALCPLEYSFTDLVDGLAGTVNHDNFNATLLLKATSTFSGTVDFTGVGSYPVSIASDSNVTLPANLSFQNISNDGASLAFNVANYTNYDVDGFCNVTIPKNFMWSFPDDNWTITVDGATQNALITSDNTNWYVWFNFTAGSHTAMLGSTNVVPEFTSTTLLLFLMATTLIGVGVATNLKKKKFHL